MRIPLPPLNALSTSREKGQSLVEFALALPFLLVMLLGAVDLGRAYQTYVVIENAAREGARWGADNPDTTRFDGIRQRVKDEASSAGIGISDGQITIACSNGNCDTAQNGEKITVSVQTDFPLVSLYLFRVSNIPMSTSATMAIISNGYTPPQP